MAGHNWIWGCALALLCAICLAAPASAKPAPVQTVWRLLDYVAVDYPEAVEAGRVVNPTEYAEMKEFSATASRLIDELPSSPAKAYLVRQAAALERHIAAKAPPQVIAGAARGLAAELIKAYPVPLAPTVAPDFARGRTLYAQHCASCHGAAGKGDGPQSAGLDPPPIAFTDPARARERSIFALFQVIEQGLEGTSMASFAQLPPQDRWALALYAGSFAYPEGLAREGEAIWRGDPALRSATDPETLVGMTSASLAGDIGEDKANAVFAYLRRHPEAAFAAPAAGTLTLARTRLADALAAYARGQRKLATERALSAYLDGFEPVEAVLSARDKALMIRIEEAMAELRSAIGRGDSLKAVRERADALDGLFRDAEVALGSNQASTTSSFVAAFTILVREGLEALLIVIAMITFLAKSGRRDVLPYVHAGWIAALAAGAATWAAAISFITISGASRELTEGLGGVIAALVLLWVGIWMHGKSQADAWQHYIRETVGRALNRRSAWLLFGLSFIAVYREVFETILFYAAIWAQGQGSAVLTGAGAALLVLALIALAMLRYSRSLPVGTFFAYSSVLVAGLAVVLIGKGSGALQEAGYLPITSWPGVPRSELLGVYPTRETFLAQLVMILLLAAGFLWNRARAHGWRAE
ncbi:FTR1 family protein [Sphingopyxis terrae]|uniref:FTR1 family protein n=1 Tax=Sphingopyxis terrae TaxID=33052 RepID=UPI003908A148